VARDEGGGGSKGILRTGRKYLFGSDDDDGFVFRPGTKDSDEKRKPIGVPEDYTAPRYNQYQDFGLSQHPSAAARATAGRTSTSDQKPRYMDGDEWKPANNSPANIGEIQKFMAAGGLLTGNWRYGVWDEKTRNAWKDVLGYANSRGITDQMALQELASAPKTPGGGEGSSGGGGGGGGGSWQIDPETGEAVWVEESFVPPEALPLNLPSREDIGRVARSAIIDIMGEGWSQTKIDQFVNQYIGMAQGRAQSAYQAEVGRQRQAFESGQPVSNVAVELQVPSPEAFAEEEVWRRDPTTATAQGAIDLFLGNIDQFWRSPVS
jgi:hypothetical protein